MEKAYKGSNVERLKRRSMNLELNTEKLESRIKSAHDEIMSEVSRNLANGEAVTDIYIDKDIAHKVHHKIKETIKEAGKSDNFHWVTLRKERNTLGHGRMMYFISETVGNQKHYRLKYRA